MEIESVVKSVTYYVDTKKDDSNYARTFMRGENGGWDERMGESWETVYSEEDELEAAFKGYMAKRGAEKP